jgi:hypothetical protein
MRTLLGMIMVVLALTGCAKSSGVIVAAQPGVAACANLVHRGVDAQGKPAQWRITDQDGEPTKFLISSLIAGVTADPSRDLDRGPNPFDAFLDCYVGEVDPGDSEKRLLRGHVLVTMLTMYGDFNLDHRSYANLEDDAALIIQGIENAELNLGAGSRLMVQAALGPTAEPERVLTSYGRVSRVADVLQVAINVERPSQVRALGTLRNVAAAVGLGAAAGVAGGAGLGDLVLDGLRGIRKAAILEVYGGALRNDARRFLRNLEGRAVTLDDWQAWDRWLDRACASIAARGDVTNRCVPSAQAMASYLDTGMPPPRTLEARAAAPGGIIR